MGRVLYNVSMSLDGFVTGRNQSLQNPLGEGGEQLHRWMYELLEWREMHGLEGGTSNKSSSIFEDDDEGAVIMGRNMFGGGPGPWKDETPWNGWWGHNPPFHKPVFVLTHYPRPVLELDGGTTFTFVSDGPRSALCQAKDVANGKNVVVLGGGHTAAQYIVLGLIDEIEIHLVPVLLGEGVRLFDLLKGVSIQFGQIRVVEAPGVTHLTYSIQVNTNVT